MSYILSTITDFLNFEHIFFDTTYIVIYITMLQYLTTLYLVDISVMKKFLWKLLLDI